jgi:hypothetical protein
MFIAALFTIDKLWSRAFFSGKASNFF